MPLDDLENHRVRPECIRQDLHESLDRLGVDAVECYWLHRDDPAVPVGELIDVLHEFVQAGLVGAYGCSNWTPARMAEADAWAAAHGRATFGAHQVGFSLGRANQNGPMGMLYMDSEMADWHRATARPVFAYSPQAVGFFGGKHTPAPGEVVDPATWRAGDPVAEKCRACYYSTENFARLARAEDLARRRGVSPNQIALAWLLAQEFPVYPIIGPRSLVQLEDGWAAQQITLTPDERDWLARA